MGEKHMGNELLQKAIQLARAQDREAAIPLLVHILKAEPENVEAWSCLLDLLADDQRRAVLNRLVKKDLGGPAAREVLEQISTEDLRPYLSGDDEDEAEAAPDEPDGQGEWLPESEGLLEAVDPPEAAASNAPAPEAAGAVPETHGAAETVEEQPPLEEAGAAQLPEPLPPFAVEQGQPESRREDQSESQFENQPEDQPEQDALERLMALSAAEAGTEGDASWHPEWQVAGVLPAEDDPGPAFSTPITRRRARRRSNLGCLAAALALLVMIVLVTGVGLAALTRRGLVNLAFLPIIPVTAPMDTAAPLPSQTPQPSPLPSQTVTQSSTVTASPSLTASLTPLPSQTPTPFAGQVISAALDGASLVYVPAGAFVMGWKYGDPGETGEHAVRLDAFWIDLDEVTNQRYAACVAAGACSPPAESKSYKRTAYYGEAEFADYPVIYVNWQQASDYCAWAGRRLPSEAEWEYAARGGDGRLFPWGKETPTPERANFAFLYRDTSAVGSFPEGASPFGVLDMGGNVAEWVNDWYIERYYSLSAEENPTGPQEGAVKAFRGGSFANQADKLRSTRRGYDAPEYVSSTLGFRCAQDAP